MSNCTPLLSPKSCSVISRSRSPRPAAVLPLQSSRVLETVSTNTYFVTDPCCELDLGYSVLQPSVLTLYLLAQSGRLNTALSVLTACSHSYPYFVGR